MKIKNKPQLNKNKYTTLKLLNTLFLKSSSVILYAVSIELALAIDKTLSELILAFNQLGRNKLLVIGKE